MWPRKHQNKEHLRELNKVRCQRYYQRHKCEIKESKKYGSIWAYRKVQEKQAREILEKIERAVKNQPELL